jgi:pyruvate/2-oxoacid:ferredoxin oxidoreductase alpha subunit
VFHVASSNVRDDQSVRSDLSDLAVVRDTGAGLLSSGSAQEVHDLAVVAHLAAAKCSLPFVHVFDGARVAFEYANVRLASTEALARVAGAVESDDASLSDGAMGVHASAAAAEAIANNVEMVMGHVAGTLKSARMFAFEYNGPADADSVIIATGVYAQVVDEGARRSRNDDGTKVS